VCSINVPVSHYFLDTVRQARVIAYLAVWQRTQVQVWQKCTYCCIGRHQHRRRSAHNTRNTSHAESAKRGQNLVHRRHIPRHQAAVPAATVDPRVCETWRHNEARTTVLHTDVTAPQTRLQSCPAAHHQPHTRPPIDGGAVGLRGSSVARCTRCVRGQSDALWLRLPLDTSCLAKDSGVNLICFLIHTMMNCLSTTCYMIVGI